jgi:hypothetical protein
VIEGRPSAHALELLDADCDFFDARVVGEMRDERGCHVRVPWDAEFAAR